MVQCPSFSHLVVIPRVRVQNANAISSPLTHGFPSITSFLGLMWALERKANAAGLSHIVFNAIGVVSHNWQEQVTDDFLKKFRLMRNPPALHGHRKLIRGDELETPSVVEEGRIHLELSLVFAVHVEEWDVERQRLDLALLTEILSSMRIAGGTIVPDYRMSSSRSQPWITDMTGDQWRKSFHQLCVRLLPGYTLVSREELIDLRLEELRRNSASVTRLDAWLSLCRVEWRYSQEANQGLGGWIANRKKGDGWIVPIPVGYVAISDLYPPGTVRNARDEEVPFRFVESLFSIGEWMGMHRLRRPADMLWWSNTQSNQGIYRCCNGYSPVS